MRIFFMLLGGLFFATNLSSQCDALQLSTIQNLQKATEGQKENKITAEGFDLASEKRTESRIIRRYNRCWKSATNTNILYEQVILWNQTDNKIIFLLSDPNAYQTLRGSIENRHDGVGKHGNVFVGKMFRYTFGQSRLDGNDYFSIEMETL